ncbi:AAA family ATPase [Listeria grayi]
MGLEIKVYIEPRDIFNSRIEHFEKKVSFSEVTKTWDSNDSSIDKLALLKANQICIISTEDCSGLNSHVLENFDSLVRILEESQIEKVLINNPPLFLLNKIKLFSEKIPIEKHQYKKVTENKIKQINKHFDEKIIGQKKAKKIICRKLLAQLIRPSKKPLVLMFYGNPGIGKTETAKYISKMLYGNDNIVREQMTMVGGEASVKYYKATTHNEDSFSKKLLNRFSNVILLDEFALAPEFFHTTFFQMFDEGEYVDQNFNVDVSNSIIICTSNLLSIRDMESSINPALLSRFDGFIEFGDFTIEEKKIIANKVYLEITASKNMRKKYRDRIDRTKILADFSKEIHSFSNMRTIRRFIEDSISNHLLEDIIEK